MAYQNIDIRIESISERYQVYIESQMGSATRHFQMPVADSVIESLLSTLTVQEGLNQPSDSSQEYAAQELGKVLFAAIFDDQTLARYSSALDHARLRNEGLRIRINLQKAPHLVSIPWEYLFSPYENNFLALSATTPIIRYLPSSHPITPVPTALPLRILGIISSPMDLPSLDVEGEKNRLQHAISPMQQSGHLALKWVEAPTLDALRTELRRHSFHVFHFIGHGFYDESQDEGILIFEDEDGKSRSVNASVLATLLRDRSTIRLAVLNACESARGGVENPFAGVAPSLLSAGLPAVIAMQFKVTDAAAIRFSTEFYRAVTDGYPIHSALTEARLAVFTEYRDIQWGAPVLYSRIPEGVIFELLPETERLPNAISSNIDAVPHQKSVDNIEALKTLVVYVPGLATTTDMWEPLISRLSNELMDEEAFGTCVWKGWNHGAGALSFKPAMSISKDLRDWIDAEWQSAGGYDHLIFIGHSMSGLLLRQAYLLAAGEYIDEPASVWAARVEKFILLAAINRGLSMKDYRNRIYDLITRMISALCFGRRMLAQDLMNGSEFITDLRLRWMSYMRRLSERNRPTVIQILGNRDGIVSRSDSIDLEQFPNAYHFSIPEVTHYEVPDLRRGKNPELRYSFIRNAILGRGLDRADERIETASKQNVVFILHGIRAANRGWVQEVGELIAKSLPDTEIVTPSYGYLSAMEFVFPFLHRRPIRTFQHIYADYFATNPKAKFHFIGHSNGTYILGQSLKSLSGMRFNRVMLAGSILPRNYPWREVIKKGQIELLRSDHANTDFPVGLLCSGLAGLGRKDIGTGGYEGFLDDDSSILQYSFHEGGHSAAVQEDNLPTIVDFIVNGVRAIKPTLVEEKETFSLLSRLSPWFFRLLILITIVLGLIALTQQIWPLLVGLLLMLLVMIFLLKIL